MGKKNLPENPDDKYQLSSKAKAFKNRDPEEENDFLPRAEINWDKVETAMELGCSLKECAEFGGVHWNTLERRILVRYGDGFREVREFYMGPRRRNIRAQFFNLVAKGNVRAVLAGMRALNGFNDRPKGDQDDDDDNDTSVFKLAYDPHEPPPIDAEYKPLENE